ncbi:MAG: CPBP family intramembrane metalloprotease, partial [Bacteroides sp.]|nr:CPBP family intramembrane metalloprotease [Bacteroides sp.]
VLGRLLDGGVNRFVALFISSTSFSLMHFFNPNFEFLPFLNILLAGVLLGASYIYTRNLCFPVALHWFWNWLQGPVLGYEVSGNRFGDTLLTLRLSDAHLMNGGSFGFEGSLLCTFLLIIGSGLIIGHYERKIRRFP